MKINDVYREICDNPHDDAPRLEFARLIEPSDRTWAAFIRHEIDATNMYRAGDVPDTYQTPSAASRWAAPLLPLAARGMIHNIKFHRGFPSLIQMHPGVFAEYGEQIFKLAPIRHVDFAAPYDEEGNIYVDERGRDEKFPIDQVLASPAVARLESIGLELLRLPRDWAKQVVACPRLDNCMYLSLHRSVHTHGDLIELLESPAMRKLVFLRSKYVGGDGESSKLGLHSARSHGQGGPETTTYFYGELTKTLEAKYGYIPWLHVKGMQRLDLHWYVANGRYPKFPAGSLPPKDEWYEVPAPLYHRATW